MRRYEMKFCDEMRVVIQSDDYRDPLNQWVQMTIGWREGKKWYVVQPIGLASAEVGEGYSVEPTFRMSHEFAIQFFEALALALEKRGIVTDSRAKVVASVEAKDLEIGYLRGLIERLLSLAEAGDRMAQEAVTSLIKGVV